MAPLVAASAPPLDLPELVMGLLGGLALFLFGTDMLSRALRFVAGDRLQGMLARLTKSRLSGVLTGTFVTSVLQSSSVTTVLVVGFVSAGLMSLAQSIPVIFGANIGTTITAQIIAFKVTHLSLLLVAAGYPLVLAGRTPQVRHYGHVVSGLGLVFLGMMVMGDSMAPLRGSETFRSMMVGLGNPFLAVGVGALFTALVQASAATTGIVIALATQGLVALPTGIAITLGANIGTCVTALLASIGKSREAGRVALAHVVFNVLGAAIWIGFVDQLAALVSFISSSAPRQIANAHTVFNVANTLLFLPWTKPLARGLARLLPERRAGVAGAVRPLELDPALLRTPSLALAAARREAGRIGDVVTSMVASSLPVVVAGDLDDLQELRARDKVVDGLHRGVLDYLRRLTQTEMTKQQTREAHALLEAVNGLEHIADVVETDLVLEGVRRIEKGVLISLPTAERIEAVHRLVTEAVRWAAEAVAEGDPERAEAVVALKPRVNELAFAAAEQQRLRLAADAPHRVETYRIETDLLEALKRVYYFAKRLSRAQGPLEEAAEAA